MPRGEQLLIAAIVVFLLVTLVGKAAVALLRYSRREPSNVVPLRRKRSGTKLRSMQPPTGWPLVLLFAPVLAFLFFGQDSGVSPKSENAVPSEIVGRVTHVRDGDTIEVAGTPVRFARLDCAEMDTAEGVSARKRMVELVRGQTVTCRLSGRRSYDRVIGRCDLEDGRNLSQTMVNEGYCGWWR